MNKKVPFSYAFPATICIMAMATAVYVCFFAAFSRYDTIQYVYIDNDDTADSVTAKLDTLGRWPSMAGFNTLSRHSHYADNIKTGRYAVKPGQTTLSLFRELKNGIQTPVMLTVPPVRTTGRLCAELARQLMVDSTAMARVLNDSDAIAKLGYNAQTLPALFIPDTYEVYWNISPESLLMRMHREHKRFWNADRQARADALHLSETQVATLASIVDEETANTAEKPMIAGMYLNRLKTNMPLQADPTIKFALKQFEMKRIWQKLLTTDSPYNTYKNTGLPPGPIKIASIKGIDAVLNAVSHDYLYMCAKEDFSGTHNFARTYQEHLKNAAKYTKALNERGIK